MYNIFFCSFKRDVKLENIFNNLILPLLIKSAFYRVFATTKNNFLIYGKILLKLKKKRIYFSVVQFNFFKNSAFINF